MLGWLLTPHGAWGVCQWNATTSGLEDWRREDKEVYLQHQKCPRAFGAGKSLLGQEEEGKLKMKPAEDRAGLVPGGKEERLITFLCCHHASSRRGGCPAEMAPPGIGSWQVEQEAGSKTRPTGSPCESRSDGSYVPNLGSTLCQRARCRAELERHEMGQNVHFRGFYKPGSKDFCLGLTSHDIFSLSPDLAWEMVWTHLHK